MSNPIAIIGNTIGVPPDPKQTRSSFTRIVYSELGFHTYGATEFDPTYSGTSFDPDGKGQRFWMWVPLDDAESTPVLSPFDMVSEDAWSKTYKLMASGFRTAVNSVMPQMLIPSRLLVDNGYHSNGLAFTAFDPPGSDTVEVFNWELDETQGITVGPTSADFYKYVQVGAFWGSQYLTVRSKDDGDAANNESILTLKNPPVAGFAPPTGDWVPGDGTGLVVQGAFMLMLNVVPLRTGTASVDDAQVNAWTIKLEFGDLELTLDSTGALVAKYKSGTSTEENGRTVNLTQGKSKQGPPQQQHIDDKDPYIITVYPVWNGVVIQDGVQGSESSVGAASTFVPKLKEPSILEAPYSAGFDPTAPAGVEVGVGAGPTLVTVDFGTELVITSSNCRFELAYLPVYFSPRCWFDEWFIASDDIPGTVDFTYGVYPLWTANGTTALLSPSPTIEQTSPPAPGPVADTSYYYIKWRLEADPTTPLPARYAGELFGSFIEVEEERDFPIKNGNGNFNVGVVGGTPADPAPSGDWTKYIQSISVSLSKDGSSGSITVDKYGFAGQDAGTVQDIGAITIAASGGDGTVPGSIFSGLAMGISESASADGATWTIPLIGLEKKMDDIALILPPFVDGFSVFRAIEYLTRYAGIISDYASAPTAGGEFLQTSEDINTPRYDWKSGTSVRSALEEVCDTRVYEYVVRDGKIYIYKINGLTGLPVILGPDRQPNYPNTRVMTIDQNPDFEDLRNEIVVIGLEGVGGGQGTNQSIPLYPRVVSRQNVTVPDIPWAKSIVEALPGTSEVNAAEMADSLAKQLQIYEILGRITIPGNAAIKPYDQWGIFVIYSVSHNLDFQSKTWTTDLELSAKTT